MKNSVWRIAALTLTLVASRPLRAEMVVEEQQTDDGALTVYKLTVTPAAAPEPALKYRLLTPESELKRGNAASFYYRALMANPAVYKSQRDKFGEAYDEWYDFQTPQAELPLDKLREASAALDGAVVKQLREAALRRDCRWDWQLDDIRGLDLIGFVLPEIQESRQLSRALLLQTRLAVAEGRYDEALAMMRVNYKMARDVSAEPLLVCGLVGVAEAMMGNLAVLELCGAKNSPNLYWALAELPRPLVDLRPAVQFEMSGGMRVFPFMIDAERVDHSPEEWARLLGDALHQLHSVGGEQAIGISGGVKGQLAAATFATVSYGPAKQRLIDSGMNPDDIERMPVGQVIAIDAAREYRRVADEFEKWWYVPYRTARLMAPAAETQFKGGKLDAGYGGMIAQLLVPALSSARNAQERLGWQLGALQTVEAIRMHAAATGELPASLAEITAVPLPENPATGEAYRYERKDDVGVLELPFSDGFPGVAWRIEITLAL